MSFHQCPDEMRRTSSEIRRRMLAQYVLRNVWFRLHPAKYGLDLGTKANWSWEGNGIKIFCIHPFEVNINMFDTSRGFLGSEVPPLFLHKDIILGAVAIDEPALVQHRGGERREPVSQNGKS
ncbi:conserved hypothetical protein [Coccidioides posadasii str. Silveira]|uniref:Uncharacterized protein n=1 Tax=Coccidioides posadasii (strain RMSCC 757 / Silveira) TaxID=443226 RepID=E9DEW7_COCPS|nr:conserved hypothetical protein [Coccidioides posadasii str. Silveira]